ncbi:MAG: STAS domain-containing protein [bacterium]|nr:STAS domain-containing protein [bacterium]
MPPQTLEIPDQLSNATAIVTFRSTLTARPQIAQFQNHVQQLVKRGANRIIVDLSATKWFGAAMLGELIAGLGIARNAGADLVLAGVPKRVEKILNVSGLTNLFQINRKPSLSGNPTP